MTTMLSKSLLTALGLTAALSLGACSTFFKSDAEKAQEQETAALYARYGSDWEEGHKDVAKGKSLIEKSIESEADAEKKQERAEDLMRDAKKLLKDAKQDRAKGERLIESGKAKMQRAEADHMRSQQQAE